MLVRYAPSVSTDVLRRLTSAFAELRAHVDDGLLGTLKREGWRFGDGRFGG